MKHELVAVWYPPARFVDSMAAVLCRVSNNIMTANVDPCLYVPTNLQVNSTLTHKLHQGPYRTPNLYTLNNLNRTPPKTLPNHHTESKETSGVWGAGPRLNTNMGLATKTVMKQISAMFPGKDGGRHTRPLYQQNLVSCLTNAIPEEYTQM